MTETHPHVDLQRRNLFTAQRAAFIGIAGSGLLATLKIIGGHAGGSSAVVADGVESAGDAVASAVVLFGLAVAARPPDEEHPYGHSRAEDVAGQSVAAMMLISGFMLLWTNADGLLQYFNTGKSERTPELFTIWIMLAALLAKGGMFFYKLAVGRSLRSMALQADAWNDFTDVLSASAVLSGISLARMGYPWGDRASAVAVSLLIMYTGVKVSRATNAALLDQQAPPELLKELRELALSIPGVAGVEKLLARRAGLTYFVDLHLEVNGEMPVRDAHEIGHKVKARLQAQHPDVADVLVHLEPAPGGRDSPVANNV